mmetsp:Transcript_1916/g.4035  ORF Transcript_1916/g.4035 Transcript_1916/m.4035 type:complete len:434 (+) Transcript_1916:737-2038(+)
MHSSEVPSPFEPQQPGLLSLRKNARERENGSQTKQREKKNAALLSPWVELTEQRLDHSVHVHLSQVGILLPCADEHHRLSRDVNHRQCSTHFVIHCIEFCQQNSVNKSWRTPLRRHVHETLVELLQLIHRIISHQRLSNEENEVRGVPRNQLGERPHQRLIILHSPRSIDQHDVKVLLLSKREGLFGDLGGVLPVPPLEQVHIQIPRVGAELLDCACPEGVARCHHHVQSPLVLEVVAHFGEIGRLSDSVHAEEADREHTVVGLCLESCSQNVDRLFGRQNSLDGFHECLLHRRGHGGEPLRFGANHSRLQRFREILSDVCRHIFGHQGLLEVLQHRLQVVLCQHFVARNALNRVRHSMEESPDDALLRRTVLRPSGFIQVLDQELVFIFGVRNFLVQSQSRPVDPAILLSNRSLPPQSLCVSGSVQRIHGLL